MKTLLMKKGPDLPRIAALVLVVILSSLSLEAFANVGDTFVSNVTGIKYEFTNTSVDPNEVKVIYKNGYSGAITIPATDTYPGNNGPVKVTAIDANAFKGNTNITSVSIGDNVTTIEAYSFQACTKLGTVTIGNGVTTISGYAFDGCTALKSVTLGNKVENIYDFAFNACSSLTSITFPSSVRHIGGAFIQSGLTEVTIPSTVTSIGNTAFNTCKSLTAVIMEGTTPPSSIGTEVFDNYNSNLVIYVPKGSKSSYLSKSDWNSKYADRIQEQSGLAYTLNGSELTVTGLASGNSDTKIEIPAKDYFSGATRNVTAIGDNAFLRNTSLTSVTIGSNVTTIGSQAFGGCTGLTSVTINGSSLTTIGESAFFQCNNTSLTSITLPSSVTSIGKTAFYQCTNLTSVTFNGTSGLKTIGEQAFRGCTSLAAITLPSSVTNINDWVFCECSNLATITLEATSVPTVGNGAFYGCKSDATLIVPNDSEKAYQKNALWKLFRYIESEKMLLVNDENGIINYNYTNSKSELEITSKDGGYSGEFVIPESVTHGKATLNVTSIGESAFNGCEGLTSITIPSGVTTIGASAFAGCTNLAKVTSNAEKAPTVANENAFANYDATLVVPDGTLGDYQKNAVWKKFKHVQSGDMLAVNNEGVIINYKQTDGGLHVASGGTYTGEFTIPATVEFNEETLAVTGICESAFEGCNEMTGIEIPGSVTSIGSKAFSGCAQLAEITTKAVVAPAVAASDAFANYDATLIVPAGAESAYQSAAVWKTFKYMQSGNMIAVYDGNVAVNYSYAGGKKTLEVTGIGDKTCSGTISISDKVKNIPVRSIGAEAFKDCAGITSVSISDSVTTIGKGAFSGCAALTSVNIPSRVTSISDETFEGCTSLTLMNIPSTVTSIGGMAFGGCSNLAEVYLTVSVPPTAASNAFEGCKSDATLYVPIGSKRVYQDAEGWKEFAKIEEYSCESFDVENEDSEEIGYKVVSDGNGGRALEVKKGDMENTSTVKIPETVTHNGETLTVTAIGANAFEGCTGLEAVEIPRSVTTIGDSAFNGCSALESITIRSTVEAIGAGAFDGCTTLKKVIAEDIPAWCGIDFGNETANPLIQAGHLYSNENEEIKNLVISEQVKKIGAYAFAGGIGLESVVISGKNLKSDLKSDMKSESYYDGVKEIGNNAFYGCNSIVEITIPSSVESIGENAFGGCDMLTTVTSQIQTPFAINSNVFDSAVEAVATLSVPKGTAEKYKAADGWKEFLTIKEVGSSTGIEDIVAGNVTIRTDGGALHIDGVKDGTRVVVYSLTGAMIGSGNVSGSTVTIPTALCKGDIAIVRIGSTAVKVMMK